MKKKLSCLLMILFMFVYTGSCAAKLAPGDYIDIKGHWAEQEIQTTVKLGLMSGMGSNAQGYQVFAPDSQLNRAQLAVVLKNVFQLDYGQTRFIKQPEASDYFGDVDNDSWYADALVMCAINNIFDNSGCFNPDENVSRIEVARSIYRAFNAKGISVPMIQLMPQFTDIQDLIREDTNAMVFVNNTGIMTGYNSCFRPHDPVKRGELASVLNRCASLLSMNENDSGKTCTVGVGETFNLSLNSNPTTGYVWTLSDTWDKTILNLAGKDYHSQANKNVVGQGGQEIFIFKALKSGKTEINLVYSRPWESVQPLKKFTAQIEVKDAEGLQIPVSWDRETRVVSLGRAALLAGSSLDFPPFEYQEGSNIVGFDMDLIQAIEKELGEDIEIKDIRFDQLIPALRAGEVDLIVSGLTIVEQRKKFMEFTTPYFDWGEIILVPKGGNQNMVIEDLAGKKIACQSGTQSQETVTDLAEKYPATQLRNYESLEDVWAAVEKGEADAAVVEHPLTAHYLTKHSESGLQMVGKVMGSQPQGIAVQKGNLELLEKLNKSLKTIKENGTYDRIYQKWFGPSCSI